jgi:hypothetical protein
MAKLNNILIVLISFLGQAKLDIFVDIIFREEMRRMNYRLRVNKTHQTSPIFLLEIC